jgi:CSLREA domain-containing protein
LATATRETKCFWIGSFDRALTGRRRPVAAVVIALGCALGAAASSRAAAATFTVNSTADTGDAADDGVCADAGGACTLRAAIDQANASPGLDVIAFAIPPLNGTLKTITPGSALPPLSDPDGVEINAFTQSGAMVNSAAAGVDAVLRVELDGHLIGSASGLTITGGDTTVKGLVINRCAGSGIAISNQGNNRIEGNFIGTDATGMTDLGNGVGVLVVNSPANVIGSTALAGRNLISGNRNGVDIEGDEASSNLVVGNVIGLAADGHLALGNEAFGVLFSDAPGNTVGGTTVAARNVISANAVAGVEILGLGAAGNVIQGNFIGTDAIGTTARGNDIGVDVSGPDSTVGGATATPGTPPGNVIAGASIGVRVPDSTATNTVILGNLIGTDVTGSVTLGGFDGIQIRSADNTIGGPTAVARNVIAGAGNAIDIIASGGGNVVQGNFIGTDITGMIGLGNGGSGIQTTGDTLIGGTATPPGSPPGNVISANGLGGIFSGESSGAIVQGNLIGTAADGTSPLGNQSHGVFFAGNTTGNTIGGASAGAGNVIAFNTGYGVLVAGSTNAAHTIESNTITSNGQGGVRVDLGTEIAIRRNAIVANTGLGIDLAGGNEDLNGVTANDAGDADSGSNDLQNFPVLMSATAAGGSLNVASTLQGAAGAAYTVELFASTVCDPSDFGEGEEFLAAVPTVAGGDGLATIEANIPVAVPLGQFITATATDAAGNTSEFSACREVAAATTPGTPFPTLPATATHTATPTPSSTASSTATPAQSATPSATRTPTASASATTTAHTPTATSSATGTATVNPTATATAAPSASPTQTSTPTATVSATGAASPSVTASPSATATASGTPATSTPSAPATATGTLSPTASPRTDTPTRPSSPTPTETPRRCPGDCNGDGEVTINELILAVNIALGNRPIDDCRAIDLNADGGATINELIAAVGAALNGCQ